MLLGVAEAVTDNLPAAAIGAAVVAIVGPLFVIVLRAFGWSISAYKDAGDFDADRVTRLETQVLALNEKLDLLEQDYREQRQLKHDWRSFAASLLQERWTIHQFSKLHGCTEIVALMERLDDLRRDHPLMTDVQTIARGDPL